MYASPTTFRPTAGDGYCSMDRTLSLLWRPLLTITVCFSTRISSKNWDSTDGPLARGQIRTMLRSLLAASLRNSSELRYIPDRHPHRFVWLESRPPLLSRALPSRHDRSVAPGTKRKGHWQQSFLNFPLSEFGYRVFGTAEGAQIRSQRNGKEARQFSN